MIIAVGHEKGGVGKSVIACNLAVMRAKQGRDVLLVDADYKPSSSLFAMVRSDSKNPLEISCVKITGKGILQELKRLRNRYDDIIVDCGGRDDQTLRAAMMSCDLLLMPVSPGPFDYWSTEQGMADKINEALAMRDDIRPVLFVNRGDTNPMVKETFEAKKALKEVMAEIAPEVVVLDQVVCSRAVFYKGISAGMAAFEYLATIEKPQKGYTNGIAEISEIYKEVFNEEFTG